MGKSGKATNEKILEAAVLVFAKKGYNAASTREIAAEAGVSEGCVFKYYKTKRDILLTVLDKVIDLFADDKTLRPLEKIIAANKGAEPSLVLKEIVKDRLKLFRENSELFKIVITESLYNKDVSNKLYNAMLTKVIHVLGDYFRHEECRGSFRQAGAGEDVVRMRTFASIMAGFVVQRVLSPGLTGIDEDRDLDAAIEIFLKGITDNGA